MSRRIAPKIAVALRKRPLNGRQLRQGDSDIITIDNGRRVIVTEQRQKVDLTKYIEERVFNFDFAYGQGSTNHQIFLDTLSPLIDNAFEGVKVSCFAYGQTGSGKTFTMRGDPNQGILGLYYLGAQQIFKNVELPQFSQLTPTVTFYEIYCGRLYDLLNQRAELKVREDNQQNIHVIGAQERCIYSANEFMELAEYGSSFRVTAQNAANNESSRSHAVLQISLKEGKKLFTKISLIDLAGNERGADHTDQGKQTRIDGAEISKSLLALKECIRALDQGKEHTPYRGSKLTMILKDSFAPTCKTLMIATVSPSTSASQNTLNTLLYADRVRDLKRDAGNQSKEDLMARQLMLPREANKTNAFKVNISSDYDQSDINAEIKIKRQKMVANMEQSQPPPNMMGKSSKGFEGRKTDSFLLIERQSNSRSKSRSNKNSLAQMSQAIKPPFPMSQGTTRNAPVGKHISNGPEPLTRSGRNGRKSTNHPLTKIPVENNRNASNVYEVDEQNRRIIAAAHSHFKSVSQIHRRFQSFKDEQTNMLTMQATAIKGEMFQLDEISKVPQLALSDVESHLQRVEKGLSQRIADLSRFREAVIGLRQKVLGASRTDTNFRGRNHNSQAAFMDAYGDYSPQEQLLDGLSDSSTGLSLF